MTWCLTDLTLVFFCFQATPSYASVFSVLRDYIADPLASYCVLINLNTLNPNVNCRHGNRNLIKMKRQNQYHNDKTDTLVLSPFSIIKVSKIAHSSQGTSVLYRIKKSMHRTTWKGQVQHKPISIRESEVMCSTRN